MFHVLVWYQNSCGNAYLTHIHHVVCCVALETEVQETGLCTNTFCHPDIRHIYYVVHDNTCFYHFSLLHLFLCLAQSITPCLSGSFEKWFWNFSAKLLSVFCVAVYTSICVSNPLLPGLWKVAIMCKMKLLSISFRPSTTYLPCPGALILRLIIILKDYDDIDNNNKSVAHLKRSA